jgi:hypothetical protein
VSPISTITHDVETGCRIGRYGDWYVRVRRGGVSFDLSLSLDRREDTFGALTLDQAARMLGMARGDLYEWGRG